MERLEGKVALVTGGSCGIGKAVCQSFAEEGATVIITDILDEEGKTIASEIQKTGATAEYHHLDVSQEEEVANLIVDIKKKYGKLDVLVNNAGISGPNKPTHEIDTEEWDKLMGINVRGVFFCTKHAIPVMKDGGSGSIINLSSIYGIIGAPDIPPYHASKGALRLMTKTDALLYAKDKIRVNSIHPGFIWTPLVEKMGEESPEGVEKYRKKLDGLHPIGHVGEPEDIAYGAVYLASDESKFVTGSELVIDGGYTAQ
ncbi:MAG: glucose 1-dehydrogenase [Candidatus Hydrogenedentota bacterium]